MGESGALIECGFPQLWGLPTTPSRQRQLQGRSGASLSTKVWECCSKTGFQSTSGRRAFGDGFGQNRKHDLGCFPPRCIHSTFENRAITEYGFPYLLWRLPATPGRQIELQGRSGASLLTKGILVDCCSKSSFQSISGRRAFGDGLGQNREHDCGCFPQLCFHSTFETLQIS